MAETFGLDTLELNDDLVGLDGFGVDSENYNDQANPAPPVAGNYTARMTGEGVVPRTDKDGNPILQNDKFPILSLPKIEIVDGLDAGGTRNVALFQDVPTKPFDRYGVPASALGDLIRAFDSSLSWRGLGEAKMLLKEFFDSNTPFTAQYDWSVYDKDFVTAALEQLEIPANREERTDEQKAAINAIYKAGRITGMRFFPFNENSGRFSHVMTLGDITFRPGKNAAPRTIEVPQRALEARLTIVRYYPSADVAAGRVKVGPINSKPAQRKLV